MSYIDCYDHEYIGSLGYLPIYHPLQEINGGSKWGDYDFNATPKNLVLGGGSGEHPGLVLHKLECIVAKFLYDQISEEEDDTLSKKDQDFIVDLAYQDDILEFCDWSIKQYATLSEMAASLAFNTPVSEDENVEDWLCKSIGELIYYSLQELNPNHDRLTQIFSNFDIQPIMRNVSCTPPGYPIMGGRMVIDGKLKWGKHRW